MRLGVTLTALCGGGMSALALLSLRCSNADPSAPDDGVELPDRSDPVDAHPTDAADGPSTVDYLVVDGAAGACDPTKPFGAPMLVPGFDPAGNRATPRLSADELTIYYTASST